MKPRPQRDASLMQIAAAVVGSAGGVQVVGPDLVRGVCDCGATLGPVESGRRGCPACGSWFEVRQAEIPLSVEQQLNTYADARGEGLYDDPAGPAYVGANGRRLMLRETDEGLYVGGVLVTDTAAAGALVAALAGGIRECVAWDSAG